MRGFWLISAAALVAGCSSEQRAATSGTANINAAADAAQGDIDTYAANSMEEKAPSATTMPKAALMRPPPKRVAAEPVPTPTSDVDGNRDAGRARAVAATHPCARGGPDVTAGRTRLSVRADDMAFERDDRDTPQQRATAGVWREGDGSGVRAGRNAGDLPAGVDCTAK